MKNLVLSVCLILLGFLQSCSSKAPCDPVGKSLISDFMVNRIPYKESSVLTFINTLTNDTHVFYSQGWIRSMVYAHLDPEKCYGDSIEGERRLDFISPTFGKKIKIGISQSKSFHLENYSLFVFIDNKRFIFDDFYSPSRTSFSYATPYQSNTNVYKLDDQYNINSGSDSCYYNFQNGIIKIMTNTENLELLKVQ